MKQVLYVVLASVFLSISLAGCGSTNATQPTTEEKQSSEEQKQEKVVITISKQNGEEVITEKEVAVKDGQTVMDVMKEHFDLETGSGGGFITTIDGVKANAEEKMAWFYSVNGKEAEVGAKEYELKPGDTVTFDMHTWE